MQRAVESSGQEQGNKRVSFRTIDPCAEPAWDSLIAKFPAATVFHTSAWAEVLRNAYGHKLCYQIAEGVGGETLGAVCVSEVDSWLTGKRGVGLPFTDECPILNDARAGFEHFWERLLALGREKKWKFIEVRGNPISSGLANSVDFLTHILQLQNAAQLFKDLTAPFRTAIRKAESAGIKVRIDHSESAIEQYYRLHCQTRRKHGAPPQPMRFFEEIFDRLIRRGMGFVAMADDGAGSVAGAVFLHSNKKAVYKFGASDQSAMNLRPNNLVMWKAIEHLANSGFESLNFGRTSVSNEGLRRFKRGWGAEEGKVGYIRFDLTKMRIAVANDRSEGWQASVFRRLPESIFKKAGAVLYPHLD